MPALCTEHVAGPRASLNGVHSPAGHPGALRRPPLLGLAVLGAQERHPHLLLCRLLLAVTPSWHCTQG